MSYNNELGRFRSTRNSYVPVSSIGFNQLRQTQSTTLKYQPTRQGQLRQNPPSTADPTRSFLQFRSYPSRTNEKPRTYRGSNYQISEHDRLTQETPTISIYRELPKQYNQHRPEISTARNFNPITTRPRFVDTSQLTDYIHKTKEKQKQPQQTNDLEKTLNKNFYDMLCLVGKGGFGKVWKVCLKRNKQMYAMKQMYKAKIIQKKSINSVMNERSLLAKLRHPFLINMNCAFQDRQNLYLIMDYINGGDLRYHIGKCRKFPQNQTKFFIANIIIGLDYLHSNKIIHRDIKPENLVFGSDGYLHITDLGISREIREQNYQDTSGTPGYMAPEVICRKNHSFQADFFALGVIGYELILGKRPYNGRNRKQIRQIMLAKQVGIKLDQIPRNWSPEAADFINRLLIRSPMQRLGYGSINQLKNHPWMKGVNWLKLTRKEIHPPYIPMSIEDDYQEYRKQISEDTIPDNLEENLLMLRDNQVQNLFEGYAFTWNINNTSLNGTQDLKGKRSTSTVESESTSRAEIHRV